MAQGCRLSPNSKLNNYSKGHSILIIIYVIYLKNVQEVLGEVLALLYFMLWRRSKTACENNPSKLWIKYAGTGMNRLRARWSTETLFCNEMLHFSRQSISFINLL